MEITRLEASSLRICAIEGRQICEAWARFEHAGVGRLGSVLGQGFVGPLSRGALVQQP